MRMNFFYWYKGDSPLAHCCRLLNNWLLPEPGEVNICICGHTERPRWIIDLRRNLSKFNKPYPDFTEWSSGGT